MDILNFALTLEYLESAFYDEAKSRMTRAAASLMSLIDLLADDESQHVAALTASIKQARRHAGAGAEGGVSRTRTRPAS